MVPITREPVALAPSKQRPCHVKKEQNGSVPKNVSGNMKGEELRGTLSPRPWALEGNFSYSIKESTKKRESRPVGASGLQEADR